MRTTGGKGVLQERLTGDTSLARVLMNTLAYGATEPRYTHGFHTYPAGLHPDAARDLLAVFPGEVVLDPFCGGGTVVVEARAAGRRAYGRDLSPVAVRVARTRAATPDDATLTRFRSTARKITAAARTAPTGRDEVWPSEQVLRGAEDWYAPHVLVELEALRRGVEEADGSVRPLLRTVLSSILVKVSWRKSDTSARRERHERPVGTTAVLFHKKARELGRRITALREALPAHTPKADIRVGDARAIRIKKPVDVVLTSPPYPGTYDYLPMQHLRGVWLGDDLRADQEIGSRRKWRVGDRSARKGWVADTVGWMRSAAAATRPGGHVVIVIGDGLTPAGTIDTLQPTLQAASKAGLLLAATASGLRPDHARDSGRWEHVIALTRGEV